MHPARDGSSQGQGFRRAPFSAQAAARPRQARQAAAQVRLGRRHFLRLIFAGTPAFAERSLARLLQAGHETVLVLTQPDRPAGRGMRSTESPVKRLALSKGIEVLQPASLRDELVVGRLRDANADAMVVAAYGQLLPSAALQCARHGAINIHASLLPRWRGAAPIQRALLAGDRETGISIMRMDKGLDTGPVYLQRAVAIDASDDAGTLHDKLAALGAEALLHVLEDIGSGVARAQPQPEEGVTYAHKVEKPEASLDWRRPADELDRSVRAFRPAPGATARLQGQALKIWRARVVAGSGNAGTVLRSEHALEVACGSDALAVDELQAAGGRRMPAVEFLRGRAIAPGTRFDLE